jgi:chloramphenicol-sensitive protein RarD
MSPSSSGILLAAGAFTFWGLAPLYWRLLGELPSPALLGHRVVWSLPSLALLVLLLRRGDRFRRALGDRTVRTRLFAAGLLVSVNWFTFIYAIEVERVLDVSVGYYLTPLVNVLLGAVVLGERLRPAQRVAVGLALVGVILRTIDHGRLPWIAVVLAISFGIYGLVKKTVNADAVVGLSVEILPIAPFALGYLFLLESGPHGFGDLDLTTRMLVILAGPITVLPLMLFAAGARRIPLATVGLLQYVAPTVQFALAVGVFGEPFRTPQLLAFILVWTALAIYTVDAHRAHRMAISRIPAPIVPK